MNYQTMQRYTMEHTSEVLRVAHAESACHGRSCTVHNLSNHLLRSWPQQWNTLFGYMERACPHGTGHPDPDEFKLFLVHDCDGCCGQATPQ